MEGGCSAVWGEGGEMEVLKNWLRHRDQVFEGFVVCVESGRMGGRSFAALEALTEIRNDVENGEYMENNNVS